MRVNSHKATYDVVKRRCIKYIESMELGLAVKCTVCSRILLQWLSSLIPWLPPHQEKGFLLQQPVLHALPWPMTVTPDRAVLVLIDTLHFCYHIPQDSHCHPRVKPLKSSLLR